MQAENIIKRPRLRSIDNLGGERHASWLELFFDLIFVLAVAQVAQVLNQDLSLTGLLEYLALFAPVWWAWIGYSFYADRFESDEVIFRLLMFAGMLAIAAVAVNVRGAFHGGGAALALSYFIVRAILIALYLRAAYHVPLARDLCVRYIIGFSIGSAFWFASIFIASPQRYYLWAVGFLIELLTPVFNFQAARRTPYDASHIPERFGLFTLIVLGEAVSTALYGIAGFDWHFRAAFVAAGGFAIAAVIWWVYYEFVETSGIRGENVSAMQIYMYAHFPISFSIAGIGAVTQHAVKEADDMAFSNGVRWTLCGSVALFLLSITAIRLSVGRRHLVWARVSAVGVILLLAFFGSSIEPFVLIGLMITVLIAEVWLESRREQEVRQVEAQSAETSQAPVCTHLQQIRDVSPNTEGCEECVKGHYQWVHLRMCQVCGHVGCCDSSKYKHATGHFHETGHPIIKSIEPGESWSWCYVDEKFV